MLNSIRNFHYSPVSVGIQASKHVVLHLLSRMGMLGWKLARRSGHTGTAIEGSTAGGGGSFKYAERGLFGGLHLGVVEVLEVLGALRARGGLAPKRGRKSVRHVEYSSQESLETVTTHEMELKSQSASRSRLEGGGRNARSGCGTLQVLTAAGSDNCGAGRLLREQEHEVQERSTALRKTRLACSGGLGLRTAD